MATKEPLTTLSGLLVMNAPSAAPRMMMNSLGCQSSSRLPPSIRKLPRTLPRTRTEPMIDNMRSHCRLKRSNWGYRPRSAFLERRTREGRLQISELIAAVEAPACESVRIDGFALHQAGDAVGQLNLATRPLADLLEFVEDRGRQHVAADDRQI